MRILEYIGLDTARVKAQFAKLRAALERDDFRSAQVKKLAGPIHGRYYRAKLDDANRLLFTLIKHADETCILLLEVVLNHDYASSRFLRGATIDEAQIIDVTLEQAASAALPVRYLHPQRTQMHLLDKPLSFDDAQQLIFQQQPPLVVVGSAGSGKTALTLEKLKLVAGEVLYVTHSAFLAQSARDLYYGQGFERDDQEAHFLSYAEFLETIAVPAGQEATWQRFRTWFARHAQTFRGLDAHQVFEEIRGVLTAQAQGPLSLEDYLALGVRQSIFAADQRAQLFDIYQKYRAWLVSDGLFDLNLLAHERMPLAAPRYDFVVVDEVQDLTMAQLALLLKTLRHPGQFLLCGDSNQIVHPNFFSWSQVKTLFWRDATLAASQQLQVLSANFRNAAKTTAVANTLLKIKHRRFGSIDRESNYLVDAIGTEPGEAILLSDRDGALKGLDEQTRRSAQVAVLVLRDEDKAAARQRFRTPLLFSVHEAKGLEYEHIVLYRFISDQRAEFAEIAEGVAADALAEDALEFRRARDKSDKSLEIYKFYVNALYVALTRAVRNVYLVESDLTHPLLALLPLSAGDAAAVRAQASSAEDWQREARRLELQGKQEQAEAIRRDVLRQAVPPWPVFNGKRLEESVDKAFGERYPSAKLHQQLFDYAAYFYQPVLAQELTAQLRFSSDAAFERECWPQRSKLLTAYAAKNFKEVLRQCEQFGTEFRSPMNHTPLMQAAITGNLPLIDALLERGADRDAADQYGQSPVHLALRRAIHDKAFAADQFAAVYDRVAPASIDLQSAQRLVRIDRHLVEYSLVQTIWALVPWMCTEASSRGLGMNVGLLLDVWGRLPQSVVPEHRKRRAYLSGVLARNELARDYAYNRRLFERVGYGYYWLAPDLFVRVREGGAERWVDCRKHLNYALLLQSAPLSLHSDLIRKSAAASAPVRQPAWATARKAREESSKQQDLDAALRRARESETLQRARQAEQAALERQRMENKLREQAVIRQREAQAVQALEAAASEPAQDPPWGTPAARRLALERAAKLRKP